MDPTEITRLEKELGATCTQPKDTVSAVQERIHSDSGFESSVNYDNEPKDFFSDISDDEDDMASDDSENGDDPNYNQLESDVLSGSDDESLSDDSDDTFSETKATRTTRTTRANSHDTNEPMTTRANSRRRDANSHATNEPMTTPYPVYPCLYKSPPFPQRPKKIPTLPEEITMTDSTPSERETFVRQTCQRLLKETMEKQDTQAKKEKERKEKEKAKKDTKEKEEEERKEKEKKKKKRPLLERVAEMLAQCPPCKYLLLFCLSLTSFKKIF